MTVLLQKKFEKGNNFDSTAAEKNEKGNNFDSAAAEKIVPCKQNAQCQRRGVKHTLFQIKVVKLIPFGAKHLKTTPFGAAHAYDFHIRECLPSPSPKKKKTSNEASCILLTVLVPAPMGQTLF